MRSIFIIAFLSLFLPRTLAAQAGPVAGSDFTVVYNPSASSPLADAADVTLVYVFDFWNVRYGTRLALWQNVLDPDTSRVHHVSMQREGGSWKATIPIPEHAALLSYVVTDGARVDGNDEKTWVSYVLNAQGKPVMNARFFNIPFLKLAREEIGVLIREAEREVVDWPENFPAYQQYFTLLLEQAKGSPRTQERIVTRIEELEERYGNNPGFLNMAAEVWYYVLQDQARALEYRNRIEQSSMWPQVFAMANRQSTQQNEAERARYHAQRREELRGGTLPEFNLHDADGDKVRFPMENGRPMILLFWASTSENSRAMLSALQTAMASLPAGALDVVAVSLDPAQEKAKARTLIDQLSLSCTLLYNQGDTLFQLGIDSIPITFLVDGKNTVRDILVGYDAGASATLRAAITRLVSGR